MSLNRMKNLIKSFNTCVEYKYESVNGQEIVVKYVDGVRDSPYFPVSEKENEPQNI